MATDAQVSISRIDTETLRVPIVGTAPLIVHKFSEKSKRQMLDAEFAQLVLADVQDGAA